MNLELRCLHLTRAGIKLKLAIYKPTSSVSTYAIHATPTPHKGAPKPQGIVKFYSGSTLLTSIFLNDKTGDGVMSIPATAELSAKITATYQGDDYYKAVTATG